MARKPKTCRECPAWAEGAQTEANMGHCTRHPPDQLVSVTTTSRTYLGPLMTYPVTLGELPACWEAPELREEPKPKNPNP